MSVEKYTLTGYIKDEKNGETLTGAMVSKYGSNIGVSANEYGFYSLTLPKGEHIISVSIIGYKTFTFSVILDQNINKIFELKEEGKNLDEIIITGEAEDKNVSSIEMSTAKLDIKQINKIPAFLGEVDVIRAIQLLPGVTTVGEGASGFNVRGGNVDQNLILLDEAPVYNSSHLFGFFSVFNPDAVKDVKLIKGGIPAQYGGRASSILDVRMKEGNNKKLAVTGGIGTVFSRISIEAPIIKEKASFIIAMRRSYLDALVKPFLTDSNPLKNTQFYFYDLTAKFNYRINEKNTIFASGYLGRDVFAASVFNFNYGNTTATARWNHIFNKKLFMNATAFYSNYDYLIQFGSTNGPNFKWRSNIINYSLKTDFIYYLNTRNIIRFGAQSLLYNFKPYDAISTFENANVNFVAERRYGTESSIFVGIEQKIFEKLTFEYGLRLSIYNYIGKGTAYYFRDTIANTTLPLQNSKNYEFGQIIQSYLNPEPRFSANYLLN